MAPVRKVLAFVALGIFLPNGLPSPDDAARVAPAPLAGYVEDGDYKASFELMDLSPPVSWLTDWMFA